MSMTALDRRDFLKVSAVAVGSAAAASAVTKKASAAEGDLDYRNHRPDRMTYRKLGLTN